MPKKMFSRERIAKEPRRATSREICLPVSPSVDIRPATVVYYKRIVAIARRYALLLRAPRRCVAPPSSFFLEFMNRTDQRRLALELLYSASFFENEPPEDFFARERENRNLPDEPYLRDTVIGTLTRADELDEIISKHARGWELTRLSRITRAILRLSICEMLTRDDVPTAVAINEAVNLAKRYAEEGAPPFVNGILNAVATERNLKDDR